LTDLTFTDDGNPELINGNLINFEKQRLVASVLRQIRAGFAQPYNNITPLKSIRKLLFELEVFDENELFRLSKILEPKGSQGVNKNAKQSRVRISKLTQSMMNRQAVSIDSNGMRPKDWQLIFSGAQVVNFAAEEVICEQGTEPLNFYRIKAGTVSLTNNVRAPSNSFASPPQQSLTNSLALLLARWLIDNRFWVRSSKYRRN